MLDILIRGGFVLTREKGIIEKGAVAIQGGRIVEVGGGEELSRKYQASKVIEASDKLVMPGFINCHTHLDSLFRRGLFDDLEECVPWLGRVLSWYYPLLDEEDYYYSGLLTCVEMIKGGITTFCECGTFPGKEECAARAVRESGMRGVLARYTWDNFGENTVPGFPKNMQETTKQCLTRGEEFIRRYHRTEDGRILAWLCLTQVPNISDALWKGVKPLVEKHGSGMMTHASVSYAMTQLTVRGFGLPDIERLGRLGVLGPNLLAAHVGWLTGSELLLLKESGTHVAHCPGSSMKGAYGCISHGRFPEMVSMGVNVTLGTDSPASSNNMDMVRQMYLAATAHKEARLDPALFSASLVVDMATINGARALGLADEIGSLEAGKKADIIIFDLLRAGWVPFSKETLLRNLVYATSGESVDTTIIDGKVVMEGRKITTLDEERIIDRCQGLFRKFVEKADWLPKA